MSHTSRITDGRSLRPLPGRATTVAVASAGAVALWATATQLLGIEVRAPEMGGEAPAVITSTKVAVTSLVASTGGWGLLAVLERFTRHARRIWLTMAVIVLVASLGAPLTGHGITAANQVVLALLHLTVAAVVIPGLLRTTRPTASAPTSPHIDHAGAVR